MLYFFELRLLGLQQLFDLLHNASYLELVLVPLDINVTFENPINFRSHVFHPLVDAYEMLHNMLETLHLGKLIYLPARVLIDVEFTDHSTELSLQQVGNINVSS